MELSDCAPEEATQDLPEHEGTLPAEPVRDEEETTQKRIEHWAGIDGAIYTEGEPGDVWLFSPDAAFETLPPE